MQPTFNGPSFAIMGDTVICRPWEITLPLPPLPNDRHYTTAPAIFCGVPIGVGRVFDGPEDATVGFWVDGGMGEGVAVALTYPSDGVAVLREDRSAATRWQIVRVLAAGGCMDIFAAIQAATRGELVAGEGAGDGIA